MTSDVLPAVFASNNSLINSSNCCSVDLPGKKPNWQGEKESDKNLIKTLKMVFSKTFEIMHNSDIGR